MLKRLLSRVKSSKYIKHNVQYIAQIFSIFNHLYATLKGLPYLLDMPVLDLNNPEEAANYICSTLAHKDSLKQLSQKILKSVSELAIAEKDRWGKTILA